ncbi:ABC transporter ATP-binding protein [Micromonospora sp. C31]|uniref:ABC transporter ATP-binding protein n=1 Tax=Micromonospora sp. C31 TaxID=2824876 RepID=UPI001B37AA7E|nr:ABC transporter ATP-binding protein [Micromonospora sp. C31]MBQ1075821.1 ABC transporter ATP-binding protein [Micromonospora sp. C31]
MTATLGEPVRGERSRHLLRQCVAEHRGALAAVCVLALIGVVLQLGQPFLIRRVLTAVQASEPYGAVAVAVLLVMVAGAGLGAVQQFLLQRTGEAVVFTARRTLIEHLLRLPVSVYDERQTGDLVSRVGADTTQLRSAVTAGVVDLVSGLLLVAGSVVAMALIDPVLLGVSLLPVAVGAVVVRLLGRRLRTLSENVQVEVGGLTAAVTRVLGAIRTIRVANATRRETAQVVRAADRARAAGVRLALVTAQIGPVVRLALQGSFVAVIGVGGYRVAQDAMSVGDLVAFTLFLFTLALPLAQVGDAVAQIQSGLGAVSRIQEILELQDEDRMMPARPVPPVRCHRAQPLLEFDRVSFHYPKGAEVLREVSFRVPDGGTTALVGPSGAGKSTILALIARLYEISDGSIRLHGRDIRDYKLVELRGVLGYVEQEAPLLAGTVRDNLTLAAPDAAESAIRRVTAAVNLEETLARSPAGLDAPVGDGGVLFSGGERQRLAVARTLLTAAPLLLFDEPTAHLDARNEHALQTTLATLAAGRTLLVVAHRLATVARAEQIVVIDSGRAVAAGRHEELMINDQLYREFATRQLLG